ncbi:MAG: hypothetical protein EBU22_05210, partial [Actinobacteria bacterium]|nr:hypothetical protein [Actinomycetota bacterium]
MRDFSTASGESLTVFTECRNTSPSCTLCMPPSPCFAASAAASAAASKPRSERSEVCAKPVVS